MPDDMFFAIDADIADANMLRFITPADTLYATAATIYAAFFHAA